MSSSATTLIPGSDPLPASDRPGPALTARESARPAPALTVSVVICAYTEQRWHDLVVAVASVDRQTVPALEVVVVCDHNAELLERVRRELPGVLSVANSDQRGLSGARNSGIAAVGGEIVAFLDDDAVAAPDWLDRLIRGYAGPDVIGVGGTVEPLWSEGRPRWFPPEFDWVVGCSYRGAPEVTAPVRNVIGANMSFRRDVLDAVGCFRNGIGRVGCRPVGCEETELCIRARHADATTTILFEPAAAVRHRVSPERSRWRYFWSRCYAEGRSKALVSRFAGAADALASERTYVRRTLPRGVARGISDAVRRRDPGGVGRAAAIVAGLAVTTAGYAAGTLSRRDA